MTAKKEKRVRKRKIEKTKIMYAVVRVIITILFVVNVVAFFTDKDDSQKSRAMFNAAQSFIRKNR